jgi:hypothetical protein
MSSIMDKFGGFLSLGLSNGSAFPIVVITLLLGATEPVIAQTWTVAPPVGGQQAAISSDGATLVFGYEGGLQISTNAGQSWVGSGSVTPYFTSVSCSGDGRIVLASEAEGGGVCFWTNWISRSQPLNANLPHGVWTGTAACTTGRLAACGTVGIFTSLDAGYTWITNNPTPGWANISMSPDGQTLVGIHNSSIYVTTNFGGIWTLTTAPSNIWIQTASSFNGRCIYAIATGAIYASSDFGASWLPTTAPALNWLSVACSYDGSKIIAGFGTNPLVGTGVYSSSDFGQTWISNNIPSPTGRSVAASADASTLLSGVGIGHPLIGTWPPALHVGISANALCLTWPAPSPGYVLRQTSNLGTPAWTTVTNTIQTTNFENQTTIPLPPAASMFYELQNP